MRITLPSGTTAEIDTSVANPKMGLVIAPDIFGLRPLFAELVSQLANEWQMAVIAVEPFPGKELSADVNERFAEMAKLDDEVHLRDLTEAADALGVDRVGLIGFCMGGMYCFKAARSDRFAKISSFYGMIHVPDLPGLGMTVDTEKLRPYLVDVEIKVNGNKIYKTTAL